MADLDGTSCLPGDRGTTDNILVDEDFPEAACLDDMVGIRLQLGQFVNRWKAVVSSDYTEQGPIKR